MEPTAPVYPRALQNRFKDARCDGHGRAGRGTMPDANRRTGKGEIVLAPGTVMRAQDGSTVVVGPCIGEGGQGWVFGATTGLGEELALKWYKQAPPNQREVLADLVERGAPSNRFLWPRSLVHRDDGLPGFGYVMDLRPPDYVGLASLLHGFDERGNHVDLSFAGTITLCHQLARSFLRLHARGLCYRDINYGNVFFRPEGGDVLICDNDNVGVDGTTGGVLGAPGFMAPEVVRMLAGPGAPGARPPSARTDLHSLAVTLFLVLFLAHPLEGAKTQRGLVNVSWQIEHYGTDPVFVFDPKDDRNRPADPAPRYWQAYPAFLRDLFLQAFTEGLHDPDARVMEGQWTKAMLRLRDLMTACQHCSGTIFFDPDQPDRPCVHCGAHQDRAPRWLQIGTTSIVLGPRTQLCSDHLGGDRDDIAILGEATQHPQDVHRWGIQNRSHDAWRALDPNGETHEVPPGRTIETLPGMRIDFGGMEGVVVER